MQERRHRDADDVEVIAREQLLPARLVAPYAVPLSQRRAHVVLEPGDACQLHVGVGGVRVGVLLPGPAHADHARPKCRPASDGQRWYESRSGARTSTNATSPRWARSTPTACMSRSRRRWTRCSVIE